MRRSSLCHVIKFSYTCNVSRLLAIPAFLHLKDKLRLSDAVIEKAACSMVSTTDKTEILVIAL